LKIANYRKFIVPEMQKSSHKILDKHVVTREKSRGISILVVEKFLPGIPDFEQFQGRRFQLFLS